MRPKDIREFGRMDVDFRLIYWKMFEDAMTGSKFTRIPEDLFSDDMRKHFTDEGFAMYFDDGLKIWELSWHPGYLEERHGI